jgi:hypothetical protein
MQSPQIIAEMASPRADDALEAQLHITTLPIVVYHAPGRWVPLLALAAGVVLGVATCVLASWLAAHGYLRP